MDDLKKEQILEDYCCNEMQKLKQICYPKICKIGGISQMNHDDLYSIALDVLRDSAERYDDSKDCKFYTFLCGNIDRKFSTYVRDRNTIKRNGEEILDENGEKVYKQTISIEASTEDGLELSEKIASTFCIENELSDEFGLSFERGFDEYSPKMQEYLHKLSKVQIKVLECMVRGYKPEEIQKILHIDLDLYKDSINAITTNRNTRKIQSLIRRKSNAR